MLMMWQMATPKQKRLAALVLAGLFGLLLVLMFVFGDVKAFALDGDPLEIFTAVESKFNTIYKGIGGVITALAGVAMAVCAFRWIFGTDPATVRSAKQWLLNIVIGLAVYWLAFLIISQIQNMTSGYGPEYLKNKGK